MDEKKYSLNDIFALLNESTQVLSKIVTVVHENEGKVQERQEMMLSEFIAMTVAHELIWDQSRLGFEENKDLVISAMEKNHYDKVAYPNYEHYGIILRGGSRKTRRRSRH